MAAGATGVAAALHPAIMVQAVSVPTDLYGYAALRRKDRNNALAFHDCRPMAAAGPRVRHPQQRREANATRHHSDDQFPRGHTGFPVEFLFRQRTHPKESSGSDDADHTHHTALLMFQDVAMKHPVAGIVRDQGDLDTFARRQQHRILPFLVAGRLPVPA